MKYATIINRVSSLLVALAFVIVNFKLDVGGMAGYGNLKVGVCMAFIVSLIWFGDFYGSITGIYSHGREIDTESPGILVSVMGWFLLVGVPVVLYLCK